MLKVFKNNNFFKYLKKFYKTLAKQNELCYNKTRGKNKNLPIIFLKKTIKVLTKFREYSKINHVSELT